MIPDNSDPNISGTDAASIPGEAVPVTPGGYGTAALNTRQFWRSDELGFLRSLAMSWRRSREMMPRDVYQSSLRPPVERVV